MRCALGALLVCLVGAGCEHRTNPGPRPPPPPPGQAALPSSMAALGDSVTTGFGSCLFLSSCTRNSWSTGNGVRVRSHLRRIAEGNPAIRRRAYNFATPGASAAHLPRQATAAVRRRVEYVTVLIGANDACRGSVAAMTSPASFRADVDRAFGTLRRGLPTARVLVVGVPNLYRLWEIGHTNTRVVRAWSAGVCPSLLANARSEAPADVARRAAVRDRVAAYNRALAAACRAYGRRCRYDGAAHRIRFTLGMLNRIDYFHPNVEGQNRIAAVTYPRRFTW